VVAGGLEQHEHVAAGPARDQKINRIGQVRDAPDRPDAAVKNIKMVLGDIDSDEARMYLHDACPCAARSAADGLDQLFRFG
jgi:hypothetical protein